MFVNIVSLVTCIIMSEHIFNTFMQKLYPHPHRIEHVDIRSVISLSKWALGVTLALAAWCDLICSI